MHDASRSFEAASDRRTPSELSTPRRTPLFATLALVLALGFFALAYLKREKRFSEAREPGLILLDINMPKKNGLEEIKSDPALRHIPVVMLTTSDRDEDIVRSYSLGACSSVRKPVSFDELKRVTSEFALYWSMVSVLPKARR